MRKNTKKNSLPSVRKEMKKFHFNTKNSFKNYVSCKTNFCDPVYIWFLRTTNTLAAARRNRRNNHHRHHRCCCCCKFLFIPFITIFVMSNTPLFLHPNPFRTHFTYNHFAPCVVSCFQTSSSPASYIDVMDRFINSIPYMWDIRQRDRQNWRNIIRDEWSFVCAHAWELHKLYAADPYCTTTVHHYVKTIQELKH